MVSQCSGVWNWRRLRRVAGVSSASLAALPYISVPLDLCLYHMGGSVLLFVCVPISTKAPIDNSSCSPNSVFVFNPESMPRFLRRSKTELRKSTSLPLTPPFLALARLVLGS